MERPGPRQVDRPGDRLLAVSGGQAAHVTCLGGEDQRIARSLDGLGQDLFRHPVGVHVGRVDEGDPAVECLPDDPQGLRFVHLSAEHHRAETEGRHLQPRASHFPILHPPPPFRLARRYPSTHRSPRPCTLSARPRKVKAICPASFRKRARCDVTHGAPATSPTAFEPRCDDRSLLRTSLHHKVRKFRLTRFLRRC